MVGTRSCALRFGLETVLIALSALVVARATASPADPSGVRSATVAWLHEHAIPVTVDGPPAGPDVTAIGAMCDGARVVALGEASHGTHEFLALRNRIFEYLIEHEGFRTIAVETGFREAQAIDAFLDTGGDLEPPDSIVRAMMSWSDDGTGPGRVENHELLRWVHDFNRHVAAGDRVHLDGFDLIGRSAGGGFPNAAVAIRVALDYARHLDPRRATDFDGRLGPLLPSFGSRSYSDKAYDHLSSTQRAGLSSTLAELAAWFEQERTPWAAATSADAYALAAHAVAEAIELDGYFQINFGHRGMSDEAQVCRDSIMAVNLRWIVQRLGGTNGVLVFAHDRHVEKGSGRSMGSFLAAQGVRALTIGTVDAIRPGGATSPASGPQGPDGIGTVCAEVGLPAFVADLRQVSGAGPVHDWLAQPRLVNPVTMRRADAYPVRVLDWYDALIFVRTLTYGS